jgi:hypothetical protein
MSEASPIYGVTLNAPAQEGGPLDELRAVVGNRTAIDAYRKGVRPFPDGTILVKLAWKHVQCQRRAIGIPLDVPPLAVAGAVIE